MSFTTRLRRFLSWDNRQPPRTHEDARAREVFDRQVGSGPFGSGGYGNRLGR